MKRGIPACVLSLLCYFGFSQNVFYIQEGAQLVCTGNAVITLQNLGSFKNNGSFIAGSSNIIIKGPANTTIIGGGSGNISFHQLTVSNQQGVQLAQSISVENTIRLVTGDLNLENNTITLSPDAVVEDESETARITDEPGNAGKVSITQSLGASPDVNAGNLGVEINATSTALGNTTITRFSTAFTKSGSTAGLIQRYYKIEPSVNSGLNASAKFYYLDAELNGIDPATTVLWKSADNGVNWFAVTPDARDVNAKYLQKNNIDGFSLWTIGTNNSVLPVALKSFTAGCNSNGSYLQWATAMEQNASHFIVEKSRDGITWNDVSHVAAAGTASHYQFEDPSGGAAYYRLKQVDVNGQSMYSGITRSQCEAGSAFIKLYPNPAKTFTSFSFHSPHAYSGKIYITDVGGRVVKKIPVTIRQGNNTVKIGLAGLAPGTYFVMTDQKTGSLTRRLIVL